MIVAKVRGKLTASNGLLAPKLLRSLGIAYREEPGLGFWDANRANLPALYSDLLKSTKEHIKALHPDNGGNGHDFDDFLKTFRTVKRLFARNGLYNSPEQQLVLLEYARRSAIVLPHGLVGKRSNRKGRA